MNAIAQKEEVWFANKGEQVPSPPQREITRLYRHLGRDAATKLLLPLCTLGIHTSSS